VATGSHIGEGFDCPALDTCSSPRRSLSKGAWSSTPGGSCVPTPAKPLPKSTTTTTPPRACSPHRWLNAPPDTPASDSPTPPHPSNAEFARSTGNYWLARLITDAPLPGTRSRAPGTQPLLNHARQQRPSAASHFPRSQHPDQPEQDATETSHIGSGYRKPLPRRTRPGPTGPGLSCSFACGRCWVRTNVG
jgi:hypothetical protein